MNWLELWTQTPIAKALGWTVLHSVWEGAAIALLLACAFAALRSSAARYGAACLALAAVLASFAATLVRLWPPPSPAGRARVSALAPAPALEPSPPGEIARPAFHPADLPPWFAPFWIAGVIAFQLRAFGGWMAALRLRRSGVCSAAAEWAARVNRLAARIRIARPVALLESSLADAPFVIGYLRPVILMPVGLLAGLPPAQVEAILAHELAHIRRQDYLVNLAQTFIEGLLFYHPAVWWISRVIRTEREHCCDDLAVAVSGDARSYAAGLAALEQSRISAAEFVPAATGGSLMKRIRRILGGPERPRAGWAPAASAAILVLAAAAGLSAWQTTPAPKAPPAAEALPQSPSAEAAAQSALDNLRRVELELQKLRTDKAQRRAAVQRLAEAAQDTQSKQNPQQAAQLQEAMKQLVELEQETLNKLAAAAQSSEATQGAQNKLRPPLAAAQLQETMKQLGELQQQADQLGATQTKQRAALANPFRKWLNEDVAYIITDQERASFKALETDAQRETFIDQFWQVRNPVPRSAQNQFKDEHYRRIAYANEHFASSIPGWKTDRGRIYITYGPPDEIEDHSSGGTYQRPASEGGGEINTFPFQQWRYKYIEGLGSNVIVEFVDPTHTNEFRMTYDPTEKDALRYVMPPQPPANSYMSVGGDPVVTVDVRPGGTVAVNIEQNALAGAWDFQLKITSNGQSIANQQEKTKLTAPADGRFQHLSAFHLQPGSYTVNVTVKDPKGATQTKAVQFFVN
jgi:GWxTD domain-containing protein